MKNITSFILNLFPRPLLIKISIKILPVLKFIFSGKHYVDPIDDAHLSRFLPYGYEKIRKNALSPSTLSLERHRLLWLYLKNETNIFRVPTKLLHIAPEQAYYKRLKQKANIDYTSLDLYSPIVDIKADITELPFDDDSFDVIICNHVLEHIEQDQLAMKEIYRVLKMGGFAILQIPLDEKLEKTYEDASIQDPEMRKKHFGQYDHVRIYGWDFFERLNLVGFKTEPLAYADSFTKEDQIKYGIENKDIIPLAYKY
ncbi:MAG: class I SAM-dependent methyltransferase [Psychroflexus sp.]|nr:class I SAM-dependent methyltransferase [Psychroflexus sp.]MDR9449231.1 class I SAM-dependent methyltransferase [Psychroflexus sp.]